MSEEIPTLTYESINLAKYGEGYQILEEKNHVYFYYGIFYDSKNKGKNLHILIRAEDELGNAILVDEEKSKLAKRLVGVDGNILNIYQDSSSSWIIQKMKEMGATKK